MPVKSALPDPDDLIALYTSGKTLEQLASIFHADTRTLRHIIISNGGTIRKIGERAKKALPEWFDDASKRYEQGESLNRLAAEYHVSPSRFKQWLIEHNIQIRTFDEGAKIALKSQTAEWWENRNRRVAEKVPRLDLPIEEIVQRYLSGESENAIAKSFGVARNAIRLRLQEAEVILRDQITANQLMMQGRTPEENLKNSLAANIAKTGKKEPIERLIRRAKTRQERRTHISPAEQLLEIWLKERGIESIPQMAVGPYNVDLGTSTVAVEIFGGGWHGYGQHFEAAPKRHSYLFDLGFNLIIIWVDGRKWPLTAAAADYVASFIQLASSDPTIRSQYRVIWGDGKEVPASELNLKHLALIPSRRTADNSGT